MKLNSYDPSNNELIGSVTVASKQDVNAAINDAKSAYKQWKLKTLQQRAELIDQAFRSVTPFQQEMGSLLSQEMGKKHDRGLGEVRGAIFAGSHYAKEAVKSLSGEPTKPNIEYRPLGVCAVISPWNYPLAMAVNLIVPALVAGNTVVFKPSEQTPLIADFLVSKLNQVLPEGVLTIVHGDGVVGSLLVESEDINLVAFTGSMAVGKQIMQKASTNLKRLVMELGGNDPMIVLEDAHIESAARFAVASSFENSGQMCTSTERIYVLPEVAEAFIEKVKQIASQYKVGPWHDQNSHLGPLINSKQLEKVQSHVTDALNKGAKLELGGESQGDNYFLPTVLTGLSEDMLMEQEETFGPVVAIAQVDSLEQAITRANDSIYGLGAVVFGRDQAKQVAAQLEAGMIGINKGPGGTGDSPWVGAKQSGYGFHGSKDGYRLFAQVTVVE